MCLQTRNLCTENISLFSEVIHLLICSQCTLSLPPKKITCFQGAEKGCIRSKWVKVILIAPATKTILKSSFSKSMKAKTPIISTMKDSRLNHFLMKLIYNEELEETDTKFITNELKVKESRIITSWLHQF